MAWLGTKKMRYFKIPLCRNFVWKVEDYFGPKGVCQWCLKSKIGVWQWVILNKQKSSNNNLFFQNKNKKLIITCV